MGHIDIERLLKSVKVEDGHIILNRPMTQEMYGKRITIKQLNWYYKWDKFTTYLGLFLSHYMNVCNALNISPTIPDKLEDLEDFRKALRITISNTLKIRNRILGKVAFWYLKRICKIGTGLKGIWMKRHFQLDDWIEIFIYVYLYNIVGVKKNLLNVLKVLKQVQSN